MIVTDAHTETLRHKGESQMKNNHELLRIGGVVQEAANERREL